MSVFKAIAAASRALAQVGISKSRENKDQGYRFRGIDDFMNTLSPILVQSGLVILPDYSSSRFEVTGETKSGSKWFTTFVDATFTLVSVEDSSTAIVKVRGEGRDNADKSANKAMSAAYKAMAAQVFCIPFGAMLDAEDEGDSESFNSAQGLQKSQVDDWLTKIKSAPTVKDLEGIWGTAMQAAQAASDREAYELFKSETKIRKTELVSA